MCIRDRYQRRVREKTPAAMPAFNMYEPESDQESMDRVDEAESAMYDALSTVDEHAAAVLAECGGDKDRAMYMLYERDCEQVAEGYSDTGLADTASREPVMDAIFDTLEGLAPQTVPQVQTGNTY
eukprot:TRINITY_DN11558_c0_g1_i1.p2 TRINITY_DN11558_c0_g1~~TRINITY_DN11558_c0_g1_i1.p2  ORF type:complete len:125 (-),score=45.41 TRINITY_DN11558_c0_g1_i1:259-633(-)